MSRTVPHTWCDKCDKRGFYDEHDADKALGKAQTKRNRTFDRNSAGTRRGMKRESRHYECGNGFYHLTEESRRVFARYAGQAA